MKKLLFVAFAALLLAACGGSSSSKDAEEKEKTLVDKMVDIYKDATSEIESADNEDALNEAATNFARAKESFYEDNKDELEKYEEELTQSEKEEAQEKIEKAQKDYYRALENKRDEISKSEN